MDSPRCETCRWWTKPRGIYEQDRRWCENPLSAAYMHVTSPKHSCREHESKAPACDDCKRLYGDEHGFPDLIVPDDVWLAISPTRDFGGLLCPSCICAAAHRAGFEKVEARFMGGPFANHYEHGWTPRPVDTLAPRRSKEELCCEHEPKREEER